MPRKKAVPRKRISKIVYKGYVPKRYPKRKRSAPVIRGINYVRQRCTLVASISPDYQATETNATLFWQQTTNGAQPPPIQGNQNLAYNSTVRFGQTVRNYDQYSITGMKVEYIPMVTQQTGAAAQTSAHLTALFKGDDLDDYATIANKDDTEIMTAPGFKSLSPFRPWKKYYSMKKLSKQQNVAWQDNQAYSAAAANSLTPACTLLRWKHTAAPQGAQPFGALKVTWYLHMRGQVAP